MKSFALALTLGLVPTAHALEIKLTENQRVYMHQVRLSVDVKDKLTAAEAIAGCETETAALKKQLDQAGVVYVILNTCNRPVENPFQKTFWAGNQIAILK